MASTLVTPAECPRCGGSGKVIARRAHFGVPGLCFTCDGSGKVESDPDTLAAQRAEAARVRRDQLAAAAPRDAYARWAATAPHEARQASVLLETNDPARFAKLLDSIVAGHPGVVPALLAYRAARLGPLA